MADSGNFIHMETRPHLKAKLLQESGQIINFSQRACFSTEELLLCCGMMFRAPYRPGAPCSRSHCRQRAEDVQRGHWRLRPQHLKVTRVRAEASEQPTCRLSDERVCEADVISAVRTLTVTLSYINHGTWLPRSLFDPGARWSPLLWFLVTLSCRRS